jgi:DNA-binding transcriptional ArsR family regulator
VSKRRRRKHIGPRIKIGEQFIAHPVALLKSTVFRTLSLTARRILDRLEIEHASHAGKHNGELACTYSDFVRHGVKRRTVPRALQRLVRFGLIEVTSRGRMSYADLRTPSRYRLTYLPTYVAEKWVLPTHEWRLAEKQNTSAKKAPGTSAKKAPGSADFPVPKGTLRPGAKMAPLSRSRAGRVGVCGTADLFSFVSYQPSSSAREEVTAPPPTLQLTAAGSSTVVTFPGRRAS